MMSEVVGGEARVLVRFAHIHRHPLAVSEKFGPAMVPVNSTMIAFRRNCRANLQSGRDANLARQGDEIGVEVGAIPGAGVTGIDGIADTPPGAVFGVTQL